MKIISSGGLGGVPSKEMEGHSHNVPAFHRLRFSRREGKYSNFRTELRDGNRDGELYHDSSSTWFEKDSGKNNNNTPFKDRWFDN